MMARIPASHGLTWLRQGISLFRRQPGKFGLLFLGYMLLLQIIGSLPVLNILAFVILPMFTMTFFHATRDMEAGKPLTLELLLAGFKSPAVKQLGILGALYIPAGITALAVASLADGGILWRMFTSSSITQEDMVSLQATGNGLTILTATLLAMAVYLPATATLWLASPLVAWQKMPTGKAIFYSFVTFYRHIGAFIVYGAGCFILCILLPALLGYVMVLLVSIQAALLIIAVLTIWFMMVIYCSVWYIYQELLVQRTGQPGFQAGEVA